MLYYICKLIEQLNKIINKIKKVGNIMFQVYNVELLDNKDHVYMEYALLAVSMESAIETAKAKAYKIISENKIVIRYVSVQDGKEQYMYSTLTKKLQKWY